MELPLKDENLAVSWYQEGAEEGDCCCQYNLGYCYEYGIGVKKNENIAMSWYLKAVTHEDEEDRDLYSTICNKLGNCYSNGVGVAQDVNKGLEFYAKAKKF